MQNLKMFTNYILLKIITKMNYLKNSKTFISLNSVASFRLKTRFVCTNPSRHHRKCINTFVQLTTTVVDIQSMNSWMHWSIYTSSMKYRLGGKFIPLKKFTPFWKGWINFFQYLKANKTIYFLAKKFINKIICIYKY